MACCSRQGATAYVGFMRLRVGTGEADTYSGILKTTDGGHTWEVVRKERPGRPAPGMDGHFEGRVNSEYDPHVYYDCLGMTVATHGSEDLLYDGLVPQHSHDGRRQDVEAVLYAQGWEEPLAHERRGRDGGE